MSGGSRLVVCIDHDYILEEGGRGSGGGQVIIVAVTSVGGGPEDIISMA